MIHRCAFCKHWHRRKNLRWSSWGWVCGHDYCWKGFQP
jgi:hypothetical protein